jgi:hypothetical protein
MVYYGMVVSLAVASAIIQIGGHRRRGWILFWCGAVMILGIGGSRFEVGADWPSYERLFENVNGVNDILAAREEKGFLLLMLGSKRLVDSYSVFVLVAFAVSFLPKAAIVRRYSADGCLSLMIYVYTVFMIYDTNGLRYGLAMSCVFLMIPYILERKLAGFLFLCVVACGFHVSAVVVVPFYWLARVRVSARVVGAAVVGALAVGLGLRAAVEVGVLQMLERFAAFNHYMVYLRDVGLGRDLDIVSLAGLQRAVTLCLALFVLRRMKAHDELQRLLRNGYAISVVLFGLFSFSGEFATRMSFYYKALEILLVPEIVSSQRSATVRVALLLFYAVSAVVAVSRLLRLPDGGLLPYQTVFGSLGSLGW